MTKMNDGPRSKRQALDMVSDKVAAWLSATSVGDMYGFEPDFTQAQRDRWDEACEEVQRRLYAMGAKRQPDQPSSD